VVIEFFRSVILSKHAPRDTAELLSHKFANKNRSLWVAYVKLTARLSRFETPERAPLIRTSIDQSVDIRRTWPALLRHIHDADVTHRNEVDCIRAVKRNFVFLNKNHNCRNNLILNLHKKKNHFLTELTLLLSNIFICIINTLVATNVISHSSTLSQITNRLNVSNRDLRNVMYASCSL